MSHNNLSRRHFLRLSALATAGALFAACAPSAPAPGAAEGEAAAAAELRFIKLAMSEGVTEFFEGTAVPKFEEANPNYTLTVDMSDWGHLGEKLLTSFAGNIPVDLVETGSDWVGPYAVRKQFLPIDDYVQKDFQDQIDDFYSDMVDLSRYDGSLMALPYILDIRTMAYRIDHFEEVGLDPETPPDTWEDLVSFGMQLVKTDDQGNITRAGYQLNASTPTDALFEYWYFLVQNGSNVIVPWGSWDTADIVFNGPEGLEALQFMYDLIHKHKISPMTGMSAKMPNLSPLGEGITSMATVNSGEIGNWRTYQPDQLPYLGIGVPLIHKERYQYSVPNVYAIGTNTKTPDAAWALMKHMVSQEIMIGMLEPDASSPPRKSVAAEAEYMQDPMLAKFQQIPEKGWGTTTPQAVDFPTLELIGNYIQAALRDEMGMQEALDTAAGEVAKKVEASLQAQ